MKHTYTNTRGVRVRVFTSKGPAFIQPGETVSFDQPLSSAPYWVKSVEEVQPVEETTTTTTTVIRTTEETTEETTKARRRRRTTTVEEE